MSDNKDYIEIKLLNGEKVYVSKNNVVGYCHFFEHKGSVTKALLKSHGCVKKGCHYFEKYDVPYWKAIEKKKRVKSHRKETARIIKTKEEEKQNKWLEIAQLLIDELRIDIRVLNIKRLPQQKYYVVFYISREAYKDWYKYHDFACALGKRLDGYIELKHIKDADGQYAVI